MIDPITLTLIGVAVLAVGVITLRRIINWFRSKSHLTARHADAVGVVIAQRMNHRQYNELNIGFSNPNADTQLVKAVVDERTGQVLAAEAEESRKSPDEELQHAIQSGDGMVIFR